MVGDRTKRSLGYRLLFYILLCSSLVTLAGTALQLYLDYQRDVSSIRGRMKQIETSYLQSIAVGAWNFDDGLVKLQLEGILSLPDMQYAEVMIKGEPFVSAGTPQQENIISQHFKLQREKNDLTIEVGTLDVVASLEGAYQRLRERVLIILATQGIKTFLMSAFILFIFQYLVARHLAVMARYAETLDLNTLDRPLVLPRLTSQERLDELDQVAEAINAMRSSLQRSSQELATKARLEGELKTAAAFQLAVLPESPPQISGFELASQFHPAREISGDYYDFIRINERYTGIVIADVSGKGVPAAMSANVARVLLRDKALTMLDPIELLCSLNRSLQPEFQPKRFLTLSYFLLDSQQGTITYTSAGHEPLVLVRQSEPGYRLLKPAGFPFSALHADIFERRLRQETYQFEPGDLLFAYTDGLTDIANEAGEMLGEEALYRLLEDSRELTANQLLTHLEQTFRRFQGQAEQTDDITMIALKRL